MRWYIMKTFSYKISLLLVIILFSVTDIVAQVNQNNLRNVNLQKNISENSDGDLVQIPFENARIKRVNTKIIKTLKRGEYLESILADYDGALYTADYYNGVIYKVKDGDLSVFWKIDGNPLGLAWADEERILVSVVDVDGLNKVYILDNEGNSKLIAKLPDAQLIKRITSLNDQEYLISDTFKGVIWKLNLVDDSVSLWCESPLLKRKNNKSIIPGVNGMKVYHDTLFVSNTSKRLLLKIPILDNNKAGQPEVIKKNVVIDDFIIDYYGNIYATTLFYDSVVKIDPYGEVTIIAQSDQGMQGCTSITARQMKKHINVRKSNIKKLIRLQKVLYVATDGGLLSSNKYDMRAAKIIELHL